MNFFEQTKGVTYTFELEDGKPLRLTYVLQPNSLREKWINEIKTRRKKGTWLDLKISNKNITHLSELTDILNSIVRELNEGYEFEILPSLSGKEDISRTTLNHLHEIFEEYGADASLYRNEKIHNLWLKLNEYIHITEIAMETTKDRFPQYSAVVTVYPPYPGQPLEEKDKLFLSTDFSWGQLYLGYNTLGKDYISAAQDDDVRVVTNEQVKVQEMYSSETWLCFQGLSIQQKVTEMQFYQWYETISQEAQELIPIENLNVLGLGRYYLGHILITKDLLDYHPVQEDWFFDQRLQKRWNNEVFSKVKRVKNIKIHE